jgi:hypothetical protein
MGEFKTWLEQGAPFDDAKATPASPRENTAKSHE